MRFRDRHDAGHQLADQLDHLRDEDPVVLALPRGGVPVAAEVADHLGCPMDVLVVRKLGLPRQPELGIGAVGEGGTTVYNHDLLDQVGIEPADLAHVAEREIDEVHRRIERYRGGRAGVDVAGRTVIVVDDGVATGFTVRAAVRILRERGAGRIVVAVPVGPRSAVEELQALADEVVCLSSPTPFTAIGPHYDDFHQVADEEVVAGLRDARSGGAGDHTDDTSQDVTLDVDGVALPGTLTRPTDAASLVVFAHGSGSSRHSPRNRAVAAALTDAGHATLLFDLLTADEGRDRTNVFDVDHLGRRLVAVADWVAARPDLADLPLVLFGASTGAAAALLAAADLGDRVSRGGVAGRAPRPRGRPAGRGERPDAPGRRRRGHAGPRAQPPGPAAAAVPHRPRGRPRRDPPVRGARGTRPGRRRHAGMGDRAHHRVLSVRHGRHGPHGQRHRSRRCGPCRHGRSLLLVVP